MFSYADPNDLLNLARVNKWLRAILLNRRTKFLWLNALRRVDDLPPRPSDMSVPCYAALVFELFCTVGIWVIFCDFDSMND